MPTHIGEVFCGINAKANPNKKKHQIAIIVAVSKFILSLLP
jgi:hypothetical protein